MILLLFPGPTLSSFSHLDSSAFTISLVRRVAKELPGVGWELSGRAEMEFESVREMVNADESRWEKLDKVGPGKSKRIIESLERSDG